MKFEVRGPGAPPGLQAPDRAGAAVPASFYAPKTFLRRGGPIPRSVGSWSRDQERRRIVADRGLKTASAAQWPADVDPPDLSRIQIVAIPWTAAFSKNALYHYGKRRVYIEERTKILAALARGSIAQACRGTEWNQRKTYLDILVEQPFHTSDAINVLDVIADLVKQAIGVDDRWFCVLRLDWRIVKDNPRVFIGIGQEAGGDQAVCSVCGHIKEVSEMTVTRPSAKRPSGRHSECRQCNREIARARHRARRAAGVPRQGSV